MIEIAFSLAIIGFALVAIIGVLPIGMNVQKDNREQTIINQDATMFMDAIRNGAQGVDDLTNYVMAITNDIHSYDNSSDYSTQLPKHYGKFGYTPTSSDTSSQFRLTSGARIVGLLSTPKYVFWQGGGGYYSNHVVAYVRSISGPANEKFPQDNSSVEDFAFSYMMTPEIVPYWTNYVDPAWVNKSNSLALDNLQANLHDVRLVFRWPFRSQGPSGSSGQSFTTLVGGQLLPVLETNYPARLEY